MVSIRKSYQLSLFRTTNFGSVNTLLVVGIGLILGGLGATLLLSSQNLNTQSKKISMNETSLVNAQSIVNIIFASFNESLQSSAHSQRSQLFNLLLDKRNKNFSDGIIELDQKKIERYLTINSRDLLRQVQRNILPAKISIKALMESTALNEDNILQDNVEKIVDISVIATVNLYGTPMRISQTQQAVIYNILPPLTSKFTLYHKTDVGHRYNRFLADANGFPVRKIGEPFSRPLILFNSPLEKKHMESILNGKSLKSVSKNIMTDAKLKPEAILKRGFLYFGRGNFADFGPGNYDASRMSILKLTGGEDPQGFGEIFQIYNENYSIGMHPVVFRQSEKTLPSFLKDPIDLENIFTNNLQTKTSGKAHVEYILDGFSETKKNPIQIELGLTDSASSLIHPYGLHRLPSRAYTVGKTYRSILRYASLKIDRVDSNSDEELLQERLKLPDLPTDINSRIAILNSLSEEEYNEDLESIYKRFESNPKNTFYNETTEDIEPKSLNLPQEFVDEEICSNYDEFNRIMSGQSLSPINTRIGFSRKDKSHFSNDETWRASWGNYLSGPIDDFDPDEWQRDRVMHWYQSQEQLQASGYITRTRDNYLIRLPSQTIGLKSDLILDKPIKILTHTNLFVEGDCHLPTVESKYLANFNCRSITFSGDTKSHKQHVIYDGFYNSRKSVSKRDPSSSILIQGGLATNTIADDFFSNTSIIVYDDRYDPLSDKYDSFYRAVLKPRLLVWGQI